MNLPVPEELISAYFDGEVTPEERGQIEPLLESSSEVRQFLEDTSKLSALLHSFPRESTPPELAANVQKRVNALEVIVSPSAVPKRTSFRREWTAFGAGMMATMASLFCCYVAFHQSKNFTNSEFTSSTREGLEELRQYSRNEMKRKSVIVSTDHDFPAGNALSDSMEVGDQSTQSVFNAPDASKPQEAESLSLLQPNTDAFDGAIVESPAPDKFLRDLKRGEIWTTVEKSVDPNSAVAVVELTVVDIIEGTDGMKLLFKQRHLPPVEGNEILAKRAGDGLKARSRGMKNNQETSDDWVVIFVKAPGAQLADALEESLKDTNVYKNLATQRPIPLPVNSVSNSTALASRKATSASSNSVVALSDNEVAFEANQAVNSFADANGMMLEDSQTANEAQKKKLSGVPDLKERSKDEASVVKADRPVAAAKLPAPQVADGVSDKANQDNAKNSGYATFQLVNNPRQPNRQQQMARGGGYSNPMNDGNAFGNRTTLFSNTQGNQIGNANMPLVQSQTPGPANFQRRMNSDNRDPQLMRLLIVLKPEHPAPGPAPAP